MQEPGAESNHVDSSSISLAAAPPSQPSTVVSGPGRFSVTFPPTGPEKPISELRREHQDSEVGTGHKFQEPSCSGHMTRMKSWPGA